MVVTTVCCSGLFASFEGFTTVNPTYTFTDGKNYMGISSDSFGFVNGSPIGYYGGVDAVFKLGDASDWKIGMLVGPSYSYGFADAGVNVNIALGLAAEGSSFGFFSFGLGGYLGADWKVTDVFGLGIGTQIGSRFVDVNLNDGDFSISGDFFISPRVSVVFYY